MTYLITLFLLTFSLLSADERVISALSSLKCYYEQQQETSEWDIPFKSSDLAILWEKACLSDDEEVFDLRHRFEANQDDESLENEITAVWNRLRAKPKYNQKKNPASSFLISANHPLKASLDSIFYASRATFDAQSMYNAGFTRFVQQPMSFVCIAGHPNLPGVLLKLYLDTEKRLKDGIPGHIWLERRCQGAKNIRDVIRKKNIKCFTVPDKHLYQLPDPPEAMLAPGVIFQRYALVVTDMDLASHQENIDAWKTKITKKHLEELYAILSQGYGSAYVAANVPLTKSGSFTFIDTEYPKRKIKYAQVKQFLSQPMAKYWDKLVKKGGN